MSMLTGLYTYIFCLWCYLHIFSTVQTIAEVEQLAICVTNTVHPPTLNCHHTHPYSLPELQVASMSSLVS